MMKMHGEEEYEEIERENLCDCGANGYSQERREKNNDIAGMLGSSTKITINGWLKIIAYAWTLKH